MQALRQSILPVLRRTFDLRAGETRLVLAMQGIIFLLIATLLVIKPTVNSLFLYRYGAESLPVAYLVVALVAGVVTLYFSKLLASRSLRHVILSTLVGCIACLVGFAFLLHQHIWTAGSLYLLYIWVAIFAVLTTSQFWLLANAVFDARQAKRLFGFIGAGAIAGGVVGGYLASLLVTLIGSTNLLLVGASLLLLALPLVYWATGQPQIGAAKLGKQKKQKKESPFAALRYVTERKHLRYLALLVGLSVLIAKLVDYQFSAIAAAQISDPDQLTAFFGFWFSTFNVVSLLVQLLLTARILSRFGVGGALALLPVGILLGAAALFVFPELWAAVAVKMVDGVFKQSVNKAGFELLVLPIPKKIKRPTKTFIDVFVDSLATGISGLLLLLVIVGLELPTSVVTGMIIAAALVWLYFVYRVRKTYVQSLRSRLRNARREQDRRQLLTQFKSDDGRGGQLATALRRLRGRRHEPLLDRAHNWLEHRDERVRLEALRYLDQQDDPDLIQRVGPLLYDPSDAVKIEAFEYLLQNLPEGRIAFYEDYLEDPNDEVSGAALVALARQWRARPALEAYFDLPEIFHFELSELAFIDDKQQLQRRRDSLIRAIGYADLPEFYPYIDQCFEQKRPQMTRSGIRAAGFSGHPRFIQPLLAYLDRGTFQEETVRALRRIGYPVFEHLRDRLSPQNPNGIFLGHLVRVLDSCDDESVSECMHGLLDHADPHVRRATARSLSRLLRKAPQLRTDPLDVQAHVTEELEAILATLTLLVSQKRLRYERRNQRLLGRRRPITKARKHLIDRIELHLFHQLETLFCYLDLGYPDADLYSYFNTLRRGHADTHGSAIELLDNILRGSFRRPVVQLLEAVFLQSNPVEVTRLLGLEELDEYAAYEQLLRSPQRDLRVAVNRLLVVLPNARAKALLAQQEGKGRTLERRA